MIEVARRRLRVPMERRDGGLLCTSFGSACVQVLVSHGLFELKEKVKGNGPIPLKPKRAANWAL